MKTLTEKEIIEGNKLIAEFIFPNIQKEIELGDMKMERLMICKASMLNMNYFGMRFHSSWDWIIEGLRKWDNLPEPGVLFDQQMLRITSTGVYKETCEILNDRVTEYEIEPVSAFRQLVLNIKWYNIEMKQSNTTE